MSETPPRPLTGPETVPDMVNNIVILAHGYGSNGADLHQLAQHLAPHFPNTAFLCPNAPEPCPGNPGGYQWFALSQLSQEERDTGTYQAAPTLNAYLDSVLERFALPGSKLALLGFSQGTMMSLHVGLRREVAGILGFSGCLAAPARLKDEISHCPPVLLVHGTHDQVLPFPLMFEAKGALEANGLTVQHHLSQNIQHSIGPDGLEKGRDFLKSILS